MVVQIGYNCKWGLANFDAAWLNASPSSNRDKTLPDDSSNMLQFHCPKCRREVSVAENRAGMRLACPACSEPIMVPGTRSSSEPTLEDLLDLGDDSVKATASRGEIRPPQPSLDVPADEEALTLSKVDYVADVEDSISNDEKEPVLELPEDSEFQLERLPDEDDEFSVSMVDTTDQLEEKPDDILPMNEDELAIPTANHSSVDDNLVSEADVQLMDDDDLMLDDLVDINQPIKVSMETTGKAPTLTELATTNPFEHDEFSPLSIDGITLPDNAITISCPICGTRIDAKPSEIGSKKKCPDCYSMIEIKSDTGPQSYELKGETKGYPSDDQSTPAANEELEPVDDDDEVHDDLEEADDIYSLAPLEDVEPVDTRLFTGSDDPLKEIERLEQQSKQSSSRSEDSREVAKPTYDLPGDTSDEQAVYVAPIDDVDSPAIDTPIDFGTTTADAIPVEPINVTPAGVDSSVKYPGDDKPIVVLPEESAQTVTPIDVSPIEVTPIDSPPQKSSSEVTEDLSESDDDPFGDDLFGDSKKKSR